VKAVGDRHGSDRPVRERDLLGDPVAHALSAHARREDLA